MRALLRRSAPLLLTLAAAGCTYDYEAPFRCANGEKDEGEIDVDCGGPCASCAPSCSADADCGSYACVQGRCAQARWEKLEPAKAPSARWGAVLAPFSDDELVLFGGGDAETLFEGTWTFAGGEWTGPISGGPPARHYAVMATDTTRQRTILLGAPEGAATGATWAWDGTAWTDEGATTPMLFGMVAGHDPTTQTMFAAGGLNTDLDFVDTLRARSSEAGASAAWEVRSDATNPPPGRVHAAGGVHHARGELVLVGGRTAKSGSDGVGETWVYAPPQDGWSSSADGPPARYGAAAAYDQDRQLLFVVGGRAGSDEMLDDVWAYDGTWHRVYPRFPKKLFFMAMAYDAAHHRMIAFGGSSSFSTAGARSDTYALYLVGTPCSASGDCGSGHCVNEVCCDTECAGGTCDDPENPGVCTTGSP